MVAAIGAVAAVAGGAIAANGAKSAAGKQSDAAYAQIEAQERQAAQMREDLSPWVESGRGANSLLNQYLGIRGGVGGGGRAYSEAELRQMLAPQFTSYGQTNTAAPAQTPGGAAAPAPAPTGGPALDLSEALTPEQAIAKYGPDGAMMYAQQKYGSYAPAMMDAFIIATGRSGYEARSGAEGDSALVNGPNAISANGTTQMTSAVDKAGLDAEVARLLADQQKSQAAYESDPSFGSLLRAYRNGEEFDPGAAFSFTGKDLANDPGYKFGLDQGTQGINRGQAARGNFLSGAAMKELTRFNEDYAGTKFNDAFNRSLGTHNTNLGARERAWGTNLSAYNDNRNRIYNFLSGTSSAGQNAATGVGNNAQQVANNVTSLATGAANAGAAGTIGSSNALASGINTAVNNYNSSNNLNSAAGWNNLLSSQGGGYSGYTGYVGNNDQIANMNTSKGWTS